MGKLRLLKDKLGFTLVEIMIVVGVILILATIGIPAMIRSKMTANETSAVAVLKVVSESCNFYVMNNSSFPGQISDLTSASPAYISLDVGNAFSGTAKDGYTFTYTAADSNFSLLGSPVKLGLTGSRYFCCDEKGSVRYSDSNSCDPDNGPQI